jgi:hypothetical protein
MLVWNTGLQEELHDLSTGRSKAVGTCCRPRALSQCRPPSDHFSSFVPTARRPEHQVKFSGTFTIDELRI